jgi:NAD(P)-dependent dehydrogenase (short-subunit alcohol dehydrogenase family)
VVARIRADGGDAVFAHCNVADRPQLARSIEATVAAFSGLHMLVNCAGIVHVGKLHEYDEEAWDYLMGVNAKAIFISLEYAVPHRLAKRAQLRGQYCLGQQSYRPGPDAGLHRLQARGAGAGALDRARLCG